MKISFTLKTKHEIMDNGFKNNSIKDFIYGCFIAGEETKNGNILFLNNNEIIKYIYDYAKKINLNAISQNKSIELNEKIKVEEIKDISSFVSGLFLSSGYISKLESLNYHLEIKFRNDKSIELIKNKLNNIKDYGDNKIFKFKQVKRRDEYILYIKKSSEISDFLKLVKAATSVFDFEEERILRDMNNFSNKYSNLDVLNAQKIADSMYEFNVMYDSLKKNNLLKNFKKSEIIFMKIKIANPSLSLQELSNIFNEKNNKKVTKSALNHWIIKMRKYYDTLDE